MLILMTSKFLKQEQQGWDKDELYKGLLRADNLIVKLFRNVCQKCIKG